MGWFRKNNKKADKTVVQPDEIESKVRILLSTRTKLVDMNTLPDNESLFTNGLLDSLAFIQLVTGIEKEFTVRLSNAGEVTAQKLDTIEQITGHVLKALNNRT